MRGGFGSAAASGRFFGGASAVVAFAGGAAGAGDYAGRVVGCGVERCDLRLFFFVVVVVFIFELLVIIAAAAAVFVVVTLACIQRFPVVERHRSSSRKLDVDAVSIKWNGSARIIFQRCE